MMHRMQQVMEIINNNAPPNITTDSRIDEVDSEASMDKLLTQIDHGESSSAMGKSTGTSHKLVQNILMQNDLCQTVDTLRPLLPYSCHLDDTGTHRTYCDRKLYNHPEIPSGPFPPGVYCTVAFPVGVSPSGCDRPDTLNKTRSSHNAVPGIEPPPPSPSRRAIRKLSQAIFRIGEISYNTGTVGKPRWVLRPYNTRDGSHSRYALTPADWGSACTVMQTTRELTAPAYPAFNGRWELPAQPDALITRRIMFDAEKSIYSIEKQPPLYDVQSKDYSDEQLKATCWNEVGEAMYDTWNETTPVEKAVAGKALQLLSRVFSERAGPIDMSRRHDSRCGAPQNTYYLCSCVYRLGKAMEVRWGAAAIPLKLRNAVLHAANTYTPSRLSQPPFPTSWSPVPSSVAYSTGLDRAGASRLHDRVHSSDEHDVSQLPIESNEQHIWSEQAVYTQLGTPSCAVTGLCDYMHVMYNPHAAAWLRSEANELAAIYLFAPPHRDWEPMKLKRRVYGATPECTGGGRRDIPEKARRTAASFGTVPTCEGPGVAPLGIEPGSPWWKENNFSLTSYAELPWRSRLVRHRSGVREALGSNPGSTQKTVAPFEFKVGLEIERKFISNRQNWWFEISIRDQQPSSTNSRSLTKVDESEIQIHEISLVQHFYYIGTKTKLYPGSELGSFDLGSGKMLVQPGIKCFSTAALSWRRTRTASLVVLSAEISRAALRRRLDQNGREPPALALFILHGPTLFMTPFLLLLSQPLLPGPTSVHSDGWLCELKRRVGEDDEQGRVSSGIKSDQWRVKSTDCEHRCSEGATSCCYNSSHPVWHALYECLQDIHGDSSPFLLKSFHELSNGFWPRPTSPHPAIQFVPNIFYKFEVGALGGPVQSANMVVGVPLHSSP
ncbi:hypothetical protein PR048_030340 [Dryococelus australis]|uniref:Uncharacterized protein n=1 Tax=Dryococelus australis TaxID=614101 RepID=A0ABQ9GCK9_9NEOP|nr:hypothetical protein PR048_030340 [Dryococelus australis]